MITASLAEVAEVLETTLTGRRVDSRSELLPPVSIDSRTIAPGNCFVAVSGARFDGHDFIDDAVGKGARVVVHSESVSAGARAADCVFLSVENTTRALQRLGSLVREKWAGLVVAVTGSMGKTTTRSFTSTLLRQRYRVRESPGNLNNHFGVPLSLLELEEADQIAVLELAMNHPGEIRTLSQICRPDMAVITNVAPVHLEFFDSIDHIAEAKAEILEGLKPGGRIIFNGEDSRVRAIAVAFDPSAIPFGTSDRCRVNVTTQSPPDLRRMEVTVQTPTGRFPASLPFSGSHYVYNLGAAVAVAVAVGLNDEDVQNGLCQLSTVSRRGQVRSLSPGRGIEVTLVDESYNSNPEALNSVLEDFSRWPWGGRKLAVLGDMLELGSSAESYHRETGQHLVDLRLDLVVTVGVLAREMSRAARDAGMPARLLVHARDSSEAAELLRGLLRNGDLLLVKASRGIGLDRMIRLLEAGFEVGEVSR